jgi:hypothetical protein
MANNFSNIFPLKIKGVRLTEILLQKDRDLLGKIAR